MSDFDRNVAADRGGYAGSAVAIDAGLRAHMIRVYNYMASAVALTGVVAYLTFTMSVVTNSAGAITGNFPTCSSLGNFGRLIGQTCQVGNFTVSDAAFETMMVENPRRLLPIGV